MMSIFYCPNNKILCSFFLLKLVTKQIKQTYIYIYDVCKFSSLPDVGLNVDKIKKIEF
jgi:hypothetical protein